MKITPFMAFLVLSAFIIQPVAYAKSMIDMERELNKINLEIIAAQSEAQAEALSIIREKDKVKRDKKLKRKINRYFRSIKRLKKRVSKKTDEAIIAQIEKIKSRLIKRGVKQEKLKNYDRMLADVRAGLFRTQLEVATTQESQNEMTEKLIERLDSDELKITDITKKNVLRSPAGLIDGIIGLWTGGDATITGIPLFDIIIHIISIPIVLTLGAIAFGAFGIGLAVYGVFYCMPKWLFTGVTGWGC